MRTLLLPCLLILMIPAAVSSEWAWFRGDIATFPASNTATGIAESIHQSTESGQDWVVLSAPPGTGSFLGLNEIVEEIKLTMPRLTPILSSGWSSNGITARILGVDSRAPIPENLPDLLTTVSTHQGIAVLESIQDSLLWSPEITTFSPFDDGAWSPHVDVGSTWDRALSAGGRLFIAGTSLGTTPGLGHQTTVWVEGNQADLIIEGLRNGTSYVSDARGIHLEFQADGATFGRTVFHKGEPFIRFRAYGRDTISSVSLIADGSEVWKATPNELFWEERFFLPAIDYSYLRVEILSDNGRYRTLSNPIFLVTERTIEGELPVADVPNGIPEDVMEVSGLIEALAGLNEDSQVRVLRELLSEPPTRYATVWLLQNRSDVIGDDVLARIAETDARNEARLGAAYALVTRGSTRATDILLEFLNTDSGALQSYAARIFAHYTEGFTENDWPTPTANRSDASGYLIRAYHPRGHDPSHIRTILTALESNESVLWSAASDKLIEMGSRSYRVIESLLSAAQGGSARAVDILGEIKDHRTIKPIHGLFQTTDDHKLKRSAFLALARMGAPYPNRRTASFASLATRPIIDADLSESEWEGASELDPLASDWDGRPSDQRVRILTGVFRDSAYVAVQVNRAPSANTIADTEQAFVRDGRVEFSFAAPPYHGKSGTLTTLALNALGLTPETAAISCRTATRATLSWWRAEMAIAVQEVASFSRFNVALVEPEGDEVRTTWSVTYGAPQDATRFGDITWEEGN